MAAAGQPLDSLQANSNLFKSSLLALKTIPHQIPRQKPLPQTGKTEVLIKVPRHS